MASFEELRTPIPKDEVLETTLSLLELAGFPVTSWQTGSVPLAILDAFAEVLSDVSFGVAAIASGATFETASGIWSKYRAVFYGEGVKVALATRGKFHFQNDNVVTVSVNPGQLIRFDQSPAIQFRVVEPAATSVAAGAAADLLVQAVSAGSNGNIAVGSALSPVTGLSGFTVSNPAIGLSGTWITSPGSDEETPEQIAERLPGKWATLATGSPEPAIRKWALDQTGVTRAKVRMTNPFGPGTVGVYIDSAGALFSTQTYINARIPAPSRAVVLLASTVNVVVPVTVTVLKGYTETALPAIIAKLLALQAQLDIGDTIIQNEVIEQIMSVPGVKDLAFSNTWAGNPNLALGATEIAVFDTSQIFIQQA